MKGFFAVLLFLFLVIGEVRCIYQFFTSDFKPSYRREAIYGFSTVTGLGCIVGWFNFADEPEEK